MEEFIVKLIVGFVAFCFAAAAGALSLSLVLLLAMLLRDIWKTRER